MSEQDKRLEQLRAAFESGLLDEDTYRAAVAGVRQQTSAQVTGSGAVAQAGGVAAGASGVAVAGSVFGNIYTGMPPRDDAEALAIYRRVYATSCRNLPLHGIDIEASDPAAKGKRLGLDHVYVDLTTTMQVSKKALAAGLKGDTGILREGQQVRKRAEISSPGGEGDESAPLPALLAARLSRRLVLLGAPGSGKSTFLSHLGLCLAMHGLEPGGGWLERLPGWPVDEGALLPVAVTLRDFARSLSPGSGKATPQQLWDFIAARLQAQNLGFAADRLNEGLEQGTVLLLLDGLDEIPTKEVRSQVRDAVAAFMARYERARVVVTCRTLSYQDRAWQLEDVPVFELAPFTAEQIDRFIIAWYDELQTLQVVKSEQAAALTRRLQEAVRRPDLRRLAPNPLLLTVMALVHTHKGRLPDARALLYEDTVDILLWRWDEVRFGEGGEAVRLRGLLQQAGRGDADLKRVLWALAFEAHRGATGGDDSLADISEWQLQKALAALHPDGSRDWAADVIAVMKLRAGLLLERAPEVYTFPHRTFQEYLAGCHLAVQGDFASRAAALVQDGAFWRQVILLAVGRLTEQGDTSKPLALVAEICPGQPLEGDLGWRKAWLAGDVLAEMGLNRVSDSALGRDLQGRVQGRLAELLRAGALAPVERAEAANVLAQMGDPRPGVGVRDGLPDIVWTDVIPPGPFPMGNDKPEAEFDFEQQRFICTLIRQPYYISRYPITVAQYAAFVADNGYQKERFWEAAIAADRWKNGKVQVNTYPLRGDSFEQWAEGPYDYGSPFNLSNHPQVGVSWYEAVAFSHWLSEMTGKDIRLPSEAEWERAARHTDGRLYPWGEGDPARHCNMVETGIGATCAVGIFPTGDAVCGAADMSGNVWEWCRTQWTSNYKRYEQEANDDLRGSATRVVRGGAFGDFAWGVRCAVRNYGYPYSRYGLFGFRVVLSPAQAGHTP